MTIQNQCFFASREVIGLNYNLGRFRKAYRAPQVHFDKSALKYVLATRPYQYMMVVKSVNDISNLPLPPFSDFANIFGSSKGVICEKNLALICLIESKKIVGAFTVDNLPAIR